MSAVESYEEGLSGSHEMVLREAEALYEGRGRLQTTYERLAQRLDGMGLAYALVGGYALILHGVRRFTEDIDLLLCEEDLAKLREDLLGKGYVSVAGTDRSIRDAETGVRIDFVLSGRFPGDGKPKPVAFPAPEDAEEIRNGVHVIDLRTLIELKLASGMTSPGRLQDLADVQRLIAEHDLDPGYAETLDPYVRERFVELCQPGANCKDES